MPAKLIDGKALAEKILLDLKPKIANLKRPPGLAAILIGDDPASLLYIKNKKIACEKIGLNFHAYFCGNKISPNITEGQIIETISRLNNNPAIDGIIVQLPIPKKFDTEKITSQIKLEKDVDGFNRQKSLKNLGTDTLISPPLIDAVNLVLTETKKDFQNKTAVILCKNPIFSEPMKKSLAEIGLNVKIVKPEKNFSASTKKADVLIVILGKKYFVQKKHGQARSNRDWYRH